MLCHPCRSPRFHWIIVKSSSHPLSISAIQGFSLKALKHLVLDEADKLLDMDFEQEIDQILKVRERSHGMEWKE